MGPVVTLDLRHVLDVACASGLKQACDASGVLVVPAQIAEDGGLSARRPVRWFRPSHGGHPRDRPGLCHRWEAAGRLWVCPDAGACAVGDRLGMAPPGVAIFSPDPLLSVTIEAQGSADDLHVHAAGQGAWVARMAAELGTVPLLCSFLGGETGKLIRPLLEALPAQVQATATRGPTGGYVVDRRGGDRRFVASSLRPPPQRHEIDDLVSSTVTAALRSAVLVLCNPYPVDGLPDEVYETLVADVRAAGVPVLVDLSSARLDHALRHEPDLVKLNDWELAEYISGPVDGPRLLQAARTLLEAGAGVVVVTRAEAPILVLQRDGDPLEIVPPSFPVGHREGCGDTMMGALSAALAHGLPLREAVILGAAAGSVNFLRHGLGTGTRTAVEEMASHVVVRDLVGTVRTAG
jgi:1-phosphofructokinase